MCFVYSHYLNDDWWEPISKNGTSSPSCTMISFPNTCHQGAIQICPNMFIVDLYKINASRLIWGHRSQFRCHFERVTYDLYMEMGVITLPNVIAFPNGKCCKHVYATPYEREREREILYKCTYHLSNMKTTSDFFTWFDIIITFKDTKACCLWYSMSCTLFAKWIN